MNYKPKTKFELNTIQTKQIERIIKFIKEQDVLRHETKKDIYIVARTKNV